MPPPGAAPSRAGRRWVRLPGLTVAAILLGAAVGSGVVRIAGWRGGLHYADIPVAELPVPTAPAGSTAPGPTPARGALAAADPENVQAHDAERSPPAVGPKEEPPHGDGAPHAAAAAPHSLEDGEPAHATVTPADPPNAPTAVGAGGRPPPAEPDPTLLERRGAAVLPVVAADGRTARRAYARIAAAPVVRGDGPRVAVVVTGVGLAREVSEAALRRLPADVTVAVSAHADDADGWLRRARAGGREAVLTLPLEPADPARVDPGPGALGVRQDPGAREAALAWLLGRGAGYVGFAADAGAFAASPDAFAAVAKELARRGLALVELGGNRLAGVAKAGGLPHVGTGPAVDEAPSAARIDLALGALEAAALRDGSAVGWARGYPVALDRLAAWAETLPGKGLRLVPASALLPEPAREGRAEPAAAAAKAAVAAR